MDDSVVGYSRNLPVVRSVGSQIHTIDLGCRDRRRRCRQNEWIKRLLLFFFALVTGSRRSLGLKLSDTRVYEPHTRARLGTTT